jgi:hypothetical protein
MKRALASRVTQDRRNLSRVAARLSCLYTYEGVSQPAVLLDLSLRGALLSSKSMPPINETISITLKPPTSEEVLKLEGMVVRGGWGISDHGAVGKFGVRFNRTPPQLLTLIGRLK